MAFLPFSHDLAQARFFFGTNDDRPARWQAMTCRFNKPLVETMILVLEIRSLSVLKWSGGKIPPPTFYGIVT
jgi:hypothetical protein